MSKPREFWMDERGDGVAILYNVGDTENVDPNNITHTREVFPDPTEAEIEKLAWEHINKNGVAHGNRDEPAWQYSLLDFNAGFHAALAWMKGER